MLKIIFNQVVKRLFPNRSMQSLTQSEILKAQNQAIQIMNRTKGKTGEVLDLTGRRIDTSRPIMGGKNVAETEAQVKARLLKTQQETLERLRNKKKTVEDFSDDGDFDPGGMASGGIARVGYAGGKLVKGASWVINKLKEQLFDLDLGIGGSRFSKLSSTQKEGFKNELKTLIKQLEQGGEIPNEMLDTMIADPKFKSVVKTRSTDKDLFELEDALLDRQAAKQADQIEGEAWDRGRDVVDSLTGPKEIKRRKQIETLKKFDVKDRKPNASGGIAGQLHLNQGGRAGFANGLSAFEEGQQIIGGGGESTGPNVEGGRIVYDLGGGQFIYESPEGFELVDRQGVYTSLGRKESIGTLDDLLDSGIVMRRPDDPVLLKEQERIKSSTPVTQTAPVTTQTAPVTTQAAPTGIQTIPGEKRSFNVMMNEQGNVMDDQSMAELARETGMAPGITNLPINSMSDVMRMVGPGESVAEGTAYNPPKKISPLADPRMARSYEENIRLMGDPRMQPPMPMGGTPIDVIPPMSNEFTTNSDEQGLINELGIERYNQLYAKGGRIGFTGGTGGNTYQDFLADKTVRPQPDDKSWRDVFYRWLDKQRANQAKGGLAHILGV